MSIQRPKVVVTHWVHPEVVELLAGSCEVVANTTRESWSRSEVVDRARDADGLMVFMPDSVDDAFLAACPRLRIIAGALKGYDNFDVAACERRGVWFTIVEDLLTEPTAELAVGLLLGLARNIAPGDRLMRSGSFHGWRPVLYGAGLASNTVGIVGMGRVGSTIARMLSGFNANLLYADPDPGAQTPHATRCGFLDLAAASDFVILAAPLNEGTRHLVNEQTLDRFKAGAYLVNIGRGSVVDETAVARALESGRLAGYAADVFEFEDWARIDRPTGIHGRFLENSDQTLLTPHLGSAVDSVRRQIALSAAHSILQAMQDREPDGAVNRPLSARG